MMVGASAFDAGSWQGSLVRDTPAAAPSPNSHLVKANQAEEGQEQCLVTQSSHRICSQQGYARQQRSHG